MPFSEIYPDQWEAWESDPSTRDSTHYFTKSAPADVTLAVAGTAQNLYLIAPGDPTVNLATNPGFETGAPPTGYTLIGSALAQSAAQFRSGANSMEVTPNNAAVGEGAYWTSPSLGSGRERANGLYLVVSAYFRRAAGAGDTVRIVIADSAGVTLQNGNTLTLSTTWQRSTAAFILPALPATYRAYFVTAAQHGTVFYVDDFQPELLNSSTPTAYCDGAQGINYEWAGTAHASMSRRRKGVAVIRGYRLHTTRDIYFAHDVTASSTTGEFLRAGTDFEEDFPIDIKSNLSFINVNAGELPRVYGRIYGVHKAS